MKSHLPLLILSGFLLFCITCKSNNSDKTESISPGTSLSEELVDSILDKERHNDTASSKESVTFAFAGDIMMGSTFPEESNNAYLPPHDGANLFDHVKEIIQQADFAAANLEGTLFDGVGTPKECKDPALCYIFKTPTRYAKNLTDAGFDFLSMANNHVNDFGEEGIVSTTNTLDKAGIKHAGLRRRNEKAILTHNGIKVGFAAFGHSKGTLSINNKTEVERIIKSLRDSVDIVVVSFHGGGEGAKYSHVPHEMEECFGEKRGNVEAFAHWAVDAGADIVYGHGPHVPRAAELYQDRLILYSLGNFCTPYRINLTGVSGQAPLVNVTTDKDGKFLGGKIHSYIQQSGKGPRRDSLNRAAVNIRKLSAQDFPKSPLKITTTGDLSF